MKRILFMLLFILGATFGFSQDFNIAGICTVDSKPGFTDLPDNCKLALDVTTGVIYAKGPASWIEGGVVDRINLDSIQITGGVGNQGLMTWNSDDETIDLVQNGAVLQLGQELHWHVRNNTGVQIDNGTVVMATGTIGASGRITVAPYDGTTDVKFIMGVATEDIENDGDGKVTLIGKVRGVNTDSWNEADVLYATTGGGLTNVAPLSGVKMAIAFVVTKHVNQGTLAVRAVPRDENILASGVYLSGGNLHIEKDTTFFVGEIRYDSTFWTDLLVPLTSSNKAGLSDPDFTQIGNDGAGSVGVYAYAFSATIEEELFFVAQLSHSYKPGTDLRTHVHWVPATTATDTVVWGLEYMVKNIGDKYGSTGTLSGKGGGTGTPGLHILTSLGSIDGTGIAESAIIIGRVYRDATNADDDMAGDVWGLDIDFHFEIDKPGSSNYNPND